VGYAVLIHSYEDKLTSENTFSRDRGRVETVDLEDSISGRS
jgi:hypothetical protein